MARYNCIFFDLDHTLWDYETNAADTLTEIYHQFELHRKGVPDSVSFLSTFKEVNTQLWELYDTGKIHRDVIRFERFHRILQQLGVNDDDLAHQLSEFYIAESPKKGALIANAPEVLEYLHKKYPLFIITNGFEEIQSTKLTSGGITHYFKSVITSARAGHKKPSREIFDFALNENGFKAHEAIMIGDNLLTDIAGARNAKVDTVLFNPLKTPHPEKVNYEIHDLRDLMTIL